MGDFDSKGGCPRSIHLLTPEYPPAPGGVAAHSRELAHGLRERGFKVVVWCPPGPSGAEVDAGHVRPVPGGFRPDALWSVGRRIRREGGVIFLQWVPHGYGLRSFNMPFCIWLWQLSCTGVPVYILFHELFHRLSGGWKFFCAGMVHRAMTFVLLRAAGRVWASSAAYCRVLRRYMPSRLREAALLPSFSSIGFLDEPDEVPVLRAVLQDRAGGLRSSVIGHFGTFNPMVCQKLEECLVQLHQRDGGLLFLLMGGGSETFHETLRPKRPDLAQRCVSTGFLSDEDVSLHLQACDLALQPCSDGLNARHTSVMAGLENAVPVATFKNWRTEPFWKAGDGLIPTQEGDTAGLCGQIIDLLGTPDRLSQIGKSGQQFYQRHCSAELVLDQVADALSR